MKFPANLTQDGKHLLITFRDIPGAATYGKTAEEAVHKAHDDLEVALDVYFQEGRQVPSPSKPKRGEYLVELPPSIAAKVLLLNTMIAQGTRPADLARSLGTSPQAVNRLLDLHHATKIDSIARALKVLGRSLELSLA